MKKQFIFLAFISFLFAGHAISQKLTFLDSFESYNKIQHWSNSDTIPNLYEDSKGELRAFGVNRNSGFFYEFTYINGAFEKTDSAAFDGMDETHFLVGPEYKGVRSISHRTQYWNQTLIESKRTMNLNGSSMKFGKLGSWKRGDGFANFHRNHNDTNLLVNQLEKGFIYNGLYHFYGAVQGQSHQGTAGLYTFDGDSIFRIELDMSSEILATAKYQIRNDTIFCEGIRSGNYRDLYICDYKTGKQLGSNPVFKSIGIESNDWEQYHIKTIAGGGYFRKTEVSQNKTKLQVTHLGDIDAPDSSTWVLHGAWFKGAFYMSHVHRKPNNGPLEGYISRYKDSKWSTYKLIDNDWGARSMRFVVGKKRLYLSYSPSRPFGVPSANHVYSIDDHLSSIPESNFSQFSIYPNPSNGFVNVQTSFNTMIKQIEVYDLLGHVVKVVEANSNKVQVDIAELPVGMYFFKINGQESVRVIKTAQ